MKTKFLNAFVIALILFQAVAPVGVLAYTTTGPSDYAPGATVYISGDNSDGAGFAPDESVLVEVSGPNGFAASCTAIADTNAAWACALELPADASDGSYSYTATGQTSGFQQSGGFTVTAPATPAVDPTQEPTQSPTAEPTQELTQAPTEEPATTPTVEPTAEPTSTAPVIPAPAPFIQSDKDDYLAGETVTLTSGNWQSGETVHIFVNDDTGASWYLNIDVHADDSGNFTYRFSLPNWFVAVYSVVATGSVSGTARTTFTDSRQINSVTLNGGSSVVVAGGASITTAVNVTTDNGGGNNNWRGTAWLISNSTPASNSSLLTCRDTTDRSGNGTSFTESFSITAPSTPGTYNAHFFAYSNDICTQGASLIFTLSNAVTVTGGTTLTLSAPSPASVTYASAGPVALTANLKRTTPTPAINISGATITFLVDGNPVGTGITNSNGDATLSYDPSALNAGSRTVTASFAGQTLSGITYTGSTSGNQTLTVTQATSTTTVTCPVSVTYTGAALTPCTVSVTGAGSLSLSPTATYSNNLNVGTATASYTYAGDTNHTGSSDSETFSITKADSTTTVSCPMSQVYTGAALEPCTAAVTGPGSLNESLSVTYTDNVNVGTATASASYAGDDNHNGSSDSETFSITQAASTTTVTCPSNVTYTGDALEPCTATVTGAGGLSQALSVTYANNTNTGSAAASASYAGDVNHSSSSDSKNFTIDKAVSTVIVTCPDSQVYTGAAIEPCTAEATGAGLSPIDVSDSLSYTDNIIVGTATADASYDGDANHTGSTGSETFEITKAASVVTVSCPSNVIYTGLALTPCTANVTGVGGLNQSLTVTYAANTNAGTATASASFAGDANHDGSSNSANFTIDPAASTTVVTCEEGPFTYTGAAQTPCSVSVTGAGGLNLTPDPIYADNVDAGTATASYTYAGDANHSGSSDSKTFEIGQAASTTLVTCDPGPFTYDGTAQEPCSVSVTGAGGLSFTADPVYIDNIDAGTATASYTYAGDANHTGSSDSETFTIDKAASTTAVSCPANVTYTGAPHEPCTASVTGVGGLSGSLSVSYANNMDAGTATASASYAGDANHLASGDSENFTIDKAATVTVVDCPANVTYTGAALEPCTANVTGAGGLDEDLSVAYVNNTNAGTATANASYAGDANHLASTDSQTFTIDQAATVTLVTCPTNVTYSGFALTPCSASVTGAGGLDESLTVLYSNNIDVGTASASASYPGDGNHLASGDNETFTIDKAASVTTVTCPTNVAFTGDPLEPCTANVTGAGDLNESLIVSYVDNTDAGTATASASYAGDDNHESSSDSQDFTIDKAASVTTITCPTNVIYTGAPLTPCTASVTGAGGLNEVLTVSYADNTDAGTATASASYAGDANHEPSTDTETFDIDKADSVTAITCPSNVTYTGSAIEPCTANVTGAGDLDQELIVVYSNNTDAGTATSSASYAGDANHNPSSASQDFTIDKATSTTVVSCPASVTYTGSALTPCTATVTGAGDLNQALIVSYTDNTNAGVATASASYAGDANHEPSSDSATFNIDRADSVTTVTCDAGPFIYNGAAHEPCSVTVTGAGSLNLTLDPDYTDNVNAGTATASYTYAGDANHNGSSDSETFTIDKAASLTLVTCPANVTYIGAALTPCTANVTGAGGLDEALTVSYSDNTNAGTAAASASYAGDANHEASGDSETFTIDKAASVTVVTCPTNVTYTGAAHEPCTANVTGAGGLNEDLSVSYTANINAGTATASASYAGDANHEPSSDSHTFEIDKAASVTVVTCPLSVTYSGAAQTPCTANVTGAGGLDEELTVSYADNTDAGTATASAGYAGDANHEASDDSAEFTIDPASSTTVVTCPTNVTYTGAALTPCSAVVTGAGELNQVLTVSYTDNTNAGTATASASFAGDANHTGSNDSQEFTIDPAASTTTVTCPASQVYTGSAIEPCTANVTGAGGLDQSLTVSYADNVIVGTATASASFAGDANHLGSFDSETFIITQAASTVTVTCPASQVYTGVAIEPCSAEATGVGMSPVDVTDSLIYSDNLIVGTATADASWDGDSNHFGSTGSETFAITKAASTVTVACPVSQGYTGFAITPCTAEANGAGLSPIDVSASLSYTSNTNVGTATVNASWAGDDNHFGSVGSETFEITPAASFTVVTCAAGPFVYDGSAFTPCSATVTGAGGLSQSLTVSYADNTNAGTATANASYAGDANHNGSNDSETFTIDQASSTTAVTCPLNVTYTGAALTPCTAVVTGAGGLNQALTLSYSNNVNAGTASASASFAGDANHTGSSDSETFTIDKAASTTTVTCLSSVTFTGAALTPCSANVTGAGALTQSLTVSYTDNVNAGTATASASFAGDANHLGSNDSKTFTVDKAASVTTVTCAAGPFVYNAAAHTPCSATVTGAGGLNAALTVSYTNNVNAGTATASASYAGDANHLTSSDSKNFTIAKAPSTTAVACPATVYFTGLPLTPCTAAVTGVGGLNQSLTVTYTNNVNVGTATASASYAGDANHLASSDSKNFTIGAWTLRGFYQPVDMNNVYNIVRAGSTVPLKFEIFSNTTELTDLLAVDSLTYAQITCSGSAITDEIETLSSGSTSLRYDSTDGQFIYNWKTPTGTAGKCYRVTMKTDDGSSLVAYFKMK